MLGWSLIFCLDHSGQWNIMHSRYFYTRTFLGVAFFFFFDLKQLMLIFCKNVIEVLR